MIKTYYYNQQLKKFSLAFASIFAGLRVRTGLGRDGTFTEFEVPIRYASADRVVESIYASNTQNKQYSLPAMSVYMSSLDLAPERLHGVGGVDRRTYIKQGGVYPDDVKAITRTMPIPYNMSMDLSIHASNTDQLYQLIEQIGMIFDPYVFQLQVNDKTFDWTRLTTVELISFGNEESIPTGTERRVLQQTLNFKLPIYLSPPAEIRDDIIKQINIRYGDLKNFRIDEIDADGNLAPFVVEWEGGTTEVNVPLPGDDPVDPPAIHMQVNERYNPNI